MATFIGYVMAETQRAILFHDHFWKNPDWMPKSQIEMITDDQSCELVVVATPWICGKKDIHEFKERDNDPPD
jgi:hypothetical protein